MHPSLACIRLPLWARCDPIWGSCVLNESVKWGIFSSACLFLCVWLSFNRRQRWDCVCGWRVGGAVVVHVMTPAEEPYRLSTSNLIERRRTGEEEYERQKPPHSRQQYRWYAFQHWREALFLRYITYGQQQQFVVLIWPHARLVRHTTGPCARLP